MNRKCLIAVLISVLGFSQASWGQVTTTGSVTNIGPSNLGETQDVPNLATVGSSANGTATVNGAGTILNFTNGASVDALLRVGTDDGTGTFTIGNGATVNITAGAGADDALFFVSDVPGAAVSPASLQGTVTIFGGSFLNLMAPNNAPSFGSVASIGVGREGPGTLSVTDSTVNVTSTGPNNGDDAVLHVGGRSFGGNNAVSVGSVTVTNSMLTFDAQGGGDSAVTVGRGTTAPNATTAPENTMLIQSGSTLTVKATGTGPAFFGVGRDGARGTTTVDGSTLNVEDFLSIGLSGGMGTLHVQNNAIVNNGGNPSDIGFTRVGSNGGIGELNINSGGVYNSRDLQIGRDANSSGTVNLNGTGSQLNVAETIFVGRDSAGVLNIGDDPMTGAVETGGTINGNALVAGANTGSVGTINMSGPNVSVNLTGLRPDFNNPNDFDGAILSASSAGTSTININGGAQVHIAPGVPIVQPGNSPARSFGGLAIGGLGPGELPGGPGSGTVNINGLNTKLTVSDENGHAGRVQVGIQDTGTLNITNGAVLDGSDVVTSAVGREASATGSVNVSGAGSKWQFGQDLFIGTDVDFSTSTPNGPGGTGTVIVTDQGVIEGTNIYVGSNGTLGGNATVIANVTSDGGTVSPGISPGVLSIMGDYTQLAGSTLLVEIESATEFDVLDVMGSIDIQGGTLEVALLNGYIPSIDDMFAFIFAGGNITGGFEKIIFPTFNGRTFDLAFDSDGGLSLTTAPVPIPATLPLLLMAFAGLGYLRWRKKVKTRYDHQSQSYAAAN